MPFLLFILLLVIPVVSVCLAWLIVTFWYVILAVVIVFGVFLFLALAGS